MCENNFTSSQLIIFFISMYQFLFCGGVYFLLYKMNQSNQQNKNHYSKYNYSKYNLLLQDIESNFSNDSSSSDSSSSDSNESNSNESNSNDSESKTLDIDDDDNEYAEEDDDDNEYAEEDDSDEPYESDEAPVNKVVSINNIKAYDTDVHKKKYKYVNRPNQTDFDSSYVSDSDSDNNFVNKKKNL
jgi:hypothetical protein